MNAAPKGRIGREDGGEDEDRVRSFFVQERQRFNSSSACKRPRNTEDVKNLECAVRCLRSDLQIPSAVYHNLWSTATNLHVTDFPNCIQTAEHRYCRLMKAFDRMELHCHLTECARRVILLVLEYEIGALQSTSDRGTTNTGATETSLMAAIREFAGICEYSPQKIKRLRREARSVSELAMQGGLGAVFLVGSQSREL